MERPSFSAVAQHIASPPESVTCRKRLIAAPVIKPFDDTTDMSILSRAATVVEDKSLDNFVDEQFNRNPRFESQANYPQMFGQEGGSKKIIVPEEMFCSTPFSTPSSAVAAARRRDLVDWESAQYDTTDDLDNTLTGHGDTLDPFPRVQQRRRRPALDQGVKTMTCKVIVIGPSGAGKSSFIRQYIEKKFSGSVPATVGMDCFRAKVNYSSTHTVQLELWDIMGQDHYYRDGLTRPFYKNSSAAVLMFDVTNRMSFLRALEWKTYLDETCCLPDGSPLPCLLVGNKCDLLEKRTVGVREVEATLKVSPYVGFMEVSSKTNDNIEKATRLILDDFVKRSMEAPPTVELEESFEQSVKLEEQSIKLSLTEPSVLDLSVKNTTCCS